MKKITNKKFASALLRGAVAVSGITCTLVTMLFCDSFYGIIAVAFVGAGIVSLINETITNNLNKK